MMKRLRNSMLVLLLVVSLLLTRVNAQMQEDEQTLNHQVWLPLVVSPSAVHLLDEHEQYIFEQINEIRTEEGVAPLSVDRRLIDSAHRHAKDMAEHNTFGHVGTDGTRAGDRMLEAGYDWIAWGENCAYTYDGNSNSLTFQRGRVMIMWQESSGHYRLMVSDRYEDIGVARVANDTYTFWVVNFGTHQ